MDIHRVISHHQGMGRRDGGVFQNLQKSVRSRFAGRSGVPTKNGLKAGFQSKMLKDAKAGRVRLVGEQGGSKGALQKLEHSRVRLGIDHAVLQIMLQKVAMDFGCQGFIEGAGTAANEIHGAIADKRNNGGNGVLIKSEMMQAEIDRAGKIYARVKEGTVKVKNKKRQAWTDRIHGGHCGV